MAENNNPRHATGQPNRQMTPVQSQGAASHPLPRRAIWIALAVVVVSIGLIVGAVVYRIHRNGPAPIPAASSSATIQTIPATSEPAATQGAQPPNPLADLLYFLNWPITSSDPNVRAYESDAQSAFKSYATSLMLFLASEHTDFTTLTDPVAGEWTSTAGYFVFSGSEMYWYEDGSNLDDNYYHGAYMAYPGCQLNSGFSLDQGGFPCYSIFVRYSDTKTDGTVDDDTYYGLFMVTQDTPDSLYLNNQRTAQSSMLYRA